MKSLRKKNGKALLVIGCLRLMSRSTMARAELTVLMKWATITYICIKIQSLNLAIKMMTDVAMARKKEAHCFGMH